VLQAKCDKVSNSNIPVRKPANKHQMAESRFILESLEVFSSDSWRFLLPDTSRNRYEEKKYLQEPAHIFCDKATRSFLRKIYTFAEKLGVHQNFQNLNKQLPYSI